MLEMESLDCREYDDNVAMITVHRRLDGFVTDDHIFAPFCQPVLEDKPLIDHDCTKVSSARGIRGYSRDLRLLIRERDRVIHSGLP